MSPTYKATFRVATAEAIPLVEALEDAVEIETSGVLFFEDPDAQSWTIEAILPEAPEAGVLDAIAARAGVTLRMRKIETLPDIDWVKKSLADLPPIRAGRFFVCGAHDRAKAPANSIVLQIEASQAFGTGSHATTKGCLLTLDALAKRGRFSRALDLGCGSGILAFAMANLWASSGAQIVRGVDIDPISVATANENARINGLARRVRLVAGDGLGHPEIHGGAPYDLIVANILAGPLVHLARPVAEGLEPGGRLILSGLLADQEAYVRAAYLAHGLRLERRLALDGWTTLTLKG